MSRILAVIPNNTEEYKKRLSDIAGDNEITFKKAADVTQEDVDCADIILGNVPRRLLHEQNIKFMQLTSAGADAYVGEGILRRDTILTCCTGAYSQTVSEHALAVTLMLLKKLHLYRDDQMASEWADEGTTGTINGATVLVVGLGDIGKQYAKMAKALGAYVIGIKRRTADKPECVDEIYTTEMFDEVVGRADIIFSVLPGTEATSYFYTEERFRKMKKSAVFINCGRGNAVSGETLYKVLSENVIACAGVDVFEKEPLDAESPLWGLKNLVITPHASGFFHLPCTLERVVGICERNLDAFLNGKELINIVDYSTGYKK